MKNFIQPGNVIPAIAPYAVASGGGVKVGSLFGIACSSTAQGATVEIARHGVYEIVAAPADTGNQGDKIYWDDTNRRVTTTATNNMLVGFLASAKSGSDTTARVLLDGVTR